MTVLCNPANPVGWNRGSLRVASAICLEVTCKATSWCILNWTAVLDVRSGSVRIWKERGRRKRESALARDLEFLNFVISIMWENNAHRCNWAAAIDGIPVFGPKIVSRGLCSVTRSKVHQYRNEWMVCSQFVDSQFQPTLLGEIGSRRLNKNSSTE